MKSLSELTEEILSLIFAGNSSFLVIDIWKCGDVVMNYKLTRCIYTITLKDRRLYSTSRWPKCLTAFTRLRSLSVTTITTLMSAPMVLMSEILKLPPTLESLELLCDDSIWSVPLLNTSCSSRTNYASYLALLSSSLNREPPFPLLNKVCHHRSPSLEYNALLPYLLSNTKVVTSSYVIDDLSLLPPLIEAFEGNANFRPPFRAHPALKYVAHVSTNKIGLVKMLESGITTNSLTIPWDADLPRLLPACLTSLSIAYSTSNVPSLPIWAESLPGTLRKLAALTAWN